jgi:5-methylcytosine-specific restriction endonuclease McrA
MQRDREVTVISRFLGCSRREAVDEARRRFNYHQGMHDNTVMVCAVQLIEGHSGNIPAKPELSQTERVAKKIHGDKFYQSREWRQLRYIALKNAGGKCQLCGAPGDEVRLHVDHIKPIARYPLLKLSLDNLQVICEDCNIGKGAWDETDWRGRD